MQTWDSASFVRSARRVFDDMPHNVRALNTEHLGIVCGKIPYGTYGRATSSLGPTPRNRSASKIPLLGDTCHEIDPLGNRADLSEENNTFQCTQSDRTAARSWSMCLVDCVCLSGKWMPRLQDSDRSYWKLQYRALRSAYVARIARGIPHGGATPLDHPQVSRQLGGERTGVHVQQAKPGSLLADHQPSQRRTRGAGA